ncbi:hypothetical protein CK203_089034 [Vitis vinifera]|uniref:Smr domain-containing protein n=1 Tax=Vitis vinifera TaxID=29760 RepID=A0A438F5K8_VITVI|nr:hypothetical protein CK203_089034 [Vitis vinifera]
MSVILPPKDKYAFCHPSNLLDILSITGSQKPLALGFPPRGRPRYNIGHPEALQSSISASLESRGNHSRGQAALPTAVRSFLNEHGYRFEEQGQGGPIIYVDSELRAR